ESREDLQRVNRALQTSNQDLEQFAYAASHDLQEPLRMVAIYSQLLKEEYGSQMDQTAHTYLDFAVGGAKRMEALLKDLLSYSRATAEPTYEEDASAEAAVQTAIANLQ